MIEVLDFYSKDCGGCRQIAPMVERVCKAKGVKLTKIDVEEEPELADKYEVSSLPTLIVIQDGDVTNMHTGTLVQAEFERLLV